MDLTLLALLLYSSYTSVLAQSTTPSTGDFQFFPPLYENSTEYGLWPLIAPLLNVSTQCRSSSIRYTDSILANPLSSRMLAASGKLPREGMFKDSYPWPICSLVPPETFDCWNSPLALVNTNLPVGYTFDYGDSELCLKAEGRHCLALFFPDFDLSSNAEALRDLARGENLRLLADYLNSNLYFRGLLFKNRELLKVLETCEECRQILGLPKHRLEPEELAVYAVVYMFVVWAGFHQTVAQRLVGFGTCVPNACEYHDMRDNLNEFMEMPLFNMIEIDTTETMKNEEYFCLDGEVDYFWTDTSTAIAIIFGILGFFIIIGTLADLLNIAVGYYKDELTEKPQQPGFGMKILLSFSLYTNLKAIMSTNQQTGDTLTCLNGMRFISMTWVVLGHNFSFVFGANVNGFVDFASFYDGSLGIAFEALVNAVPSVDTFFLVSGLLVSYLTLKELDRCNGKFKLVMFYVHRYIRLTIPIAFIIALYICVLPLIGQSTNSQFAHLISIQMSESCRKHGWSILLYVNNFYDNGNDCIGVTWYTGCDMIFFWISILVIYPMWSNSKIGASIWWMLWMLAATIPSIYQTWKFKLGIDGAPLEKSDPGFLNDYGKTPDYYRAPWIRFQPYLFGILLGYILHLTRGKKIQLNTKLNIIGWQVAFLMGFAVVYGLHDERTRTLTEHEAIFYNGFHRIAWSMSLSWVIFSCSKGYGGMINDFLSWDFFLPLSRLSFMTFLIHAEVITLSNYVFYTFGIDADWLLLTATFLGNLMISLALALILTLLFESPFVKLEKLLISKLLTTSQRVKSKQ